VRGDAVELLLARDEPLAIEGQQRGDIAQVVEARVAGALVQRDGDVAAGPEVAERDARRGRLAGARRR
jgi:hypothetical protein